MVPTAIINCYAHYIAQLLQENICLKTAIDQYPDVAQEIASGFLQKFHFSQPAPQWPSLEEVKDPLSQRSFQLWIHLIESTMRTNIYYPHRQALAIKVVRPCPELGKDLIEIFVDHPLFQGILLKSDPVARGGIRWSDRQDFRRECFQLLQTQVMKNAIIVPSGGKGAFYLKPSLQEGNKSQQALECYRLFVSSILDLSDNWQEGTITPPPGVKCYDDPDFYNVVAADKGTASFSDEANHIARHRGYWLGDAFASGGSQGYNHKKLAITSRGAWISVRHHFQGETFSSDKPLKVVGVGDMSGDIFGNGMLEERNLALLAAFNHDHIFIDPHPDPEKSYRERSRLFHLPLAKWTDYQAFSPGGGVFCRKDPWITLSPQAQEVLGLPSLHATPQEVIQYILKMPVDLLWLGGIGTFIQGQDEQGIPDHANKDLRICGAQVGARVVGEGANLGFTQQGRIEYALSGGRINTDATDNSAGVNCSDHEVNIKILLHMALRHGLLSESSRNALMQEVAQEVCSLVLKENTWQNIMISFASQNHSSQDFLDLLEILMALNPSNAHLSAMGHQIKERMGYGAAITRPEIAVLLAYSTLGLKSLVQQDSSPSRGADEVQAYFPQKIQKDFSFLIPQHLLYDKIKSTVLTNTLIHLCGPTLIYGMAKEMDLSLHQAVFQVLDFYHLFHGRSFEQAVEGVLDMPLLVYQRLELFQKTLRACLMYSHAHHIPLHEVKHTREASLKPLLEAYEEVISTYKNLNDHNLEINTSSI